MFIACKDVYLGYSKKYYNSLAQRYNYLDKHRNSTTIEINKIQKHLTIMSIHDLDEESITEPYKTYFNIDSIKIK